MSKSVKKKRFIVKCMNEKCNNYKQELNEDAEVCALCNEPTTKIETNVNRTLGMAAIGATLVSAVLMWNWYGILHYAGYVVVPASIVVAFISKSKLAIIITILTLIVCIVMFITRML